MNGDELVVSRPFIRICPGEYYPPTYFGLKNGDKVLAVLIWYGNFAVSLYFAFKVFGSANLPWKL